MSDSQLDLIILGAGPAGHIAAERAGARGKKCLVIEQAHLGGVCLNQGCIPTKTLLHSAKTYAHALHGEAFGVTAEGVRYDITKAMAWKAKVVETLRKGIAYQFRKYAVQSVTGPGRVVAKDAVEAGGTVYRAPRILLATGSLPSAIPVPGVERTIDSTGALEIKALPKSVAVIGGGYIGMEFASYFSLLGVKVTVIEMLPEIVPLLDPDIAAILRKSLPEVDFRLGARVLAVEPGRVRFSTAGTEGSVEAETVLMAVGRRPNVDGMGFETAGIDFDRKGVRVDDRMRTSVPGIWAAGDVTGRSMLAHSASRMAEVAVADMFGGEAAAAAGALGAAPRMRYTAIPWVVYTSPEVAGAGLGEEQAKREGRSVETAVLDLRANGRFIAENDKARGQCKVIVDAATRVLVGVQMIGPYASEIVWGAAAMIEAELRVKDIQEIIFPHPTVSEAIRDAVWELKA
jgi:dihydrolipoamide dehydrogenase